METLYQFAHEEIKKITLTNQFILVEISEGKKIVFAELRKNIRREIFINLGRDFIIFAEQGRSIVTERLSKEFDFSGDEIFAKLIFQE